MDSKPSCSVFSLSRDGVKGLMTDVANLAKRRDDETAAVWVAITVIWVFFWVSKKKERKKERKKEIKIKSLFPFLSGGSHHSFDMHQKRSPDGGRRH